MCNLYNTIYIFFKKNATTFNNKSNKALSSQKEERKIVSPKILFIKIEKKKEHI